MAAGLDKIKESLGKQKGLLATLALSAAMYEKSWSGVAAAVKDVAIFKLVGALVGVRGIIRDIVRDSGSLEAAIKRMSQMRGLEQMFAPLLGGVAQARQKIGELIKFTRANPSFGLDESGQAAKTFAIVTRGAVSLGEGLRLAASAAKSSGADLLETTDIVATLHREMQDGQPINDSVARLEALGAISNTSAKSILRLQESGAKLSAVFSEVDSAITANVAALGKQDATVEQLQKGVEEANTAMLATFGKPFLEGEAKGMQSAIAVANNLTPTMETLGKTLASVVDVGAGFVGSIKEAISGLPGLSTAVGVAAKSFLALATAVSAMGIGFALKNILSATAAIVAWTKAAQSGAAAQALLARQTALLGSASAAAAAGATMQATALKAQAGACGLAATGTTLFARATTAAVGGIKALGVAIMANPIGLIVTGATLAAGAIWQWVEATEAEWEAMQALRAARAESQASFEAERDAMRTMDDLNRLLAASTTELADAQKRLNAARAEGKTGQEILELENDVRNKQENLDSLSKTEYTGGLAGGEKTASMLKNRAGFEHRNKEIERENRLQSAGVAEKPALLQNELDIAKRRKEEADLLASERLRISDESNGNEDIARNLRLNSPSKTISKIAMIDANEGAGLITPREAAAQRLPLQVEQERIEQDYTTNSDKTAQLPEAIRQAELAAKTAGVELEAARQVVALRSQGLQRAREEFGIMMKMLQAQKSLASGSAEKNAIQNRMDAAQQEMDLTNKKARIQREADDASLRIIQKQQQAAQLAIEGKFEQADAVKKMADLEERAERNKARYRELVEEKAFDPKDAMKMVADEDRVAEQEKKSKADQFRKEKGRQIARLELDGQTGPGAELKRQKADDADRARRTIEEGMSAGLSSQEATNIAKTEGVAQIRADGVKASGNVVADSIASIGGGGGTYQAGGDGNSQERMVTLLGEIKAAAEATKNAILSTAPPKNPWAGETNPIPQPDL